MRQPVLGRRGLAAATGRVAGMQSAALAVINAPAAAAVLQGLKIAGGRARARGRWDPRLVREYKLPGTAVRLLMNVR